MDKIAEFREECKARLQYERKLKKKREEKQKAENKIDKKASVYLDLMVKEASIISHASKVVNGTKRVGQLLTGSHAKKLKTSLKTLNNAPATNFKDSVKIGNQIATTQKALNTELGKVRKARMATAGVGAGIAGASSISKNKQGEPNA